MVKSKLSVSHYALKDANGHGRCESSPIALLGLFKDTTELFLQTIRRIF